jgi:hypothetical protein
VVVEAMVTEATAGIVVGMAVDMEAWVDTAVDMEAWVDTAVMGKLAKLHERP